VKTFFTEYTAKNLTKHAGLINLVDSLKVWGLRPHAPPLTKSGDLLRLKIP